MLQHCWLNKCRSNTVIMAEQCCSTNNVRVIAGGGAWGPHLLWLKCLALDPFKLAGNYSQKSGNLISDILISNLFQGGGHAPDPPNSAVPLPLPAKLTFSRYGPECCSQLATQHCSRLLTTCNRLCVFTCVERDHIMAD